MREVFEDQDDGIKRMVKDRSVSGDGGNLMIACPAGFDPAGWYLHARRVYQSGPSRILHRRLGLNPCAQRRYWLEKSIGRSSPEARQHRPNPGFRRFSATVRAGINQMPQNDSTAQKPGSTGLWAAAKEGSVQPIFMADYFVYLIVIE